MTVDGVERLAFEAETRSYDAWLSDAPPDVLVRALPLDPSALVYVNVDNDAGHFNLMSGAVGGGEVSAPLVLGRNLVTG